VSAVSNLFRLSIKNTAMKKNENGMAFFFSAETVLMHEAIYFLFCQHRRSVLLFTKFSKWKVMDLHCYINHISSIWGGVCKTYRV
jgi:hypothetical protein